MLFNNIVNPKLEVIDGFTLQQWVNLLKTNKQRDAMRARNYFHGQQEEEVLAVVNDPYRGRADWKRKGITPRFRNLTKMVVEKSGLLFKDAAPVLEVFKQNEVKPDDTATTLLTEELAKIEWAEEAIKLDQTVRLLKTALLLVQWDAEEAQLILDILHRGNCEVVINPATRRPRALIHRYAAGEGSSYYSLWTLEEVVELHEADSGTVSILKREPNTYGVIPVAPFYDTQTPYTGYFVEQDKSLVNLNEMVNLHMTDSEYSIKWSKLSTAITNMLPRASSSGSGEAFGSGAGADPVTVLGGPGEVVVVDSMGVDSPFCKYEAPEIDLLSLDNVVNTWIQSVAGDWSVKVHASNTTAANSGFQLMVEEMANLDLRKQRQRMFEQAFKRFYRVIARVLNTGYGRTVLDESAEMFAKFSTPALPVDEAAQEDIWSKRIAESRATPIEYFMVVQGLTEEEATSKWQKIVEFHQQYGTSATPQALTEHTNPITQGQADSQAKSQ